MALLKCLVSNMVTRGERNNNPGNINVGQNFKGEVPSKDSRFAAFESPVMGIRAIAVVLLSYYNHHGLNTVEKIANRWAPPVENNTDAYAKDLARRLGISPIDIVHVDEPAILEKLVAGIIWHENGENIYTDQQIEDAVDAALG